MRSRRGTSVLRWVALLFLFAILFLPVYTLLRAAVSGRAELYARPYRWFPQEPTMDHFIEVVSPGHIVPILDALGNSFIISLGTAVLSVTIGAMAAYAFARLRFPFSNLIMTAVLAVYILPGALFLIPIFSLYREIGALDTRWSLILSYTAFIMPFIVIILRAFFMSIPKSLEEAARIDGCSHCQVLTRVVIPLSTPGLVAAFVSSFILAWNEFLSPLVLTSRLNVITTTLGRYSSTQEIQIGQLAAAGVYSIIPVVAVALLLNRWIRQGLVDGAVRG